MPVWAADAGIITAKDILPITGVFYGPLIFDLERANFSIGSLKCKGGSPLIEDKLTISCQSLKKSGIKKSMIYALKGENDTRPRLSYCNMENTIGYDDPSIETLIGFVQTSDFDHDPCLEFDYNVLDDATRNFKHYGGKYCDGYRFDPDPDRFKRSPDWKGGWSWYRMMSPAGTKMPEVAVPSEKCGTAATGWLNGTHPDILGESVDRTVCFNWDDNNCNWSSAVKVKKCGGYFLYYLPTPETCNFRYCAE